MNVPAGSLMRCSYRHRSCGVSSKCTWLMDFTAKLPKAVSNRAVPVWVLCSHEMAFHRAYESLALNNQVAPACWNNKDVKKVASQAWLHYF